MPHWIHVVFGTVWLVTAVVFACLAYGAHGSESTELARVTVINIPQNMRALVVGIDVAHVFHHITETTNANVAILEDSIRRAAHLAFVLNLVSCVAAFAGFAAQIGAYRYEQRREAQWYQQGTE
jgi:hypothetical protein